MNIERIYIVKDSEEKKEIICKLGGFGDTGQNSLYIEYGAIGGMPEDLKKLDLSYDFGIFNNAALEWCLGEDRRLIGGEIIMEREKRARYDEF